MKMLEKLNAKATLISTALLLGPTTVFADEEPKGGMPDALEQLKPVLEKLQRPLSIGANIVFLVLAISFGFMGFLDFLKSMQVEDARQAKELKSQAIKKFIGAGLASIGVVVINVIFTILGIQSIFTA